MPHKKALVLVRDSSEDARHQIRCPEAVKYVQEAAMTEAEEFPFTAAFPAGVAQSLVQDMAETVPEAGNPEAVCRGREAPHEHQWVLGHTPPTEPLRGSPLRLSLLWVCECGEAKVVKYKV